MALPSAQAFFDILRQTDIISWELKSQEKCFNVKKKYYLCTVNKKGKFMETTKKRTREEVRAAFRAFMREREEEQKAAQMRLEAYHERRVAVFA